MNHSVTVPISVGGTATSLKDFTISTRTITIPANQLSGVTTITILDDSIVEPTETVILTIGNVSGATIGVQKIFTLSITDDDHPATASSNRSVAVDVSPS